MAQPSVVVLHKKKPGEHPGQDAANEHGAPVEQALYAVRKAIHPRAVTGWFAAWRWLLVWATQLAF